MKTEQEWKAAEIYSRFEQISIDNETYIPPYLIREMCEICIDYIQENDIEFYGFWELVKNEFDKLITKKVFNQ